MNPIVIGLIIGGVFGVFAAIGSNRKRRDKRDARRYLAEQYRAKKRKR